MNETRYMISDAAKQVQVEAHVLRYWEEELKLPIERNELGHRYYTQEDISRFKRVKEMKDSGFQLKAIRMVLDSKSDLPDRETALAEEIWEKEEKTGDMDDYRGTGDSKALKTGGSSEDAENGEKTGLAARETGRVEAVVDGGKGEGGDNAARLTVLLKKMLLEVLRENNQELLKSAEDVMGERVIKEMNYLFREQEERQEERFKQFDELLRKRQRRRRLPSEKGGRRRFFFSKKKAFNKN